MTPNDLEMTGHSGLFGIWVICKWLMTKWPGHLRSFEVIWVIWKCWSITIRKKNLINYKFLSDYKRLSFFPWIRTCLFYWQSFCRHDHLTDTFWPALWIMPRRVSEIIVSVKWLSVKCSTLPEFVFAKLSFVHFFIWLNVIRFITLF